MKAEHTIDKAVRANRATQIAAMVITGFVALIWAYFGRLYLIHDPDEWRIANQQLGYPLYIIPLLGVTHIVGGVGLLIPNVPRLTEWAYAGLAIDARKQMVPRGPPEKRPMRDTSKPANEIRQDKTVITQGRASRQ